MGNQAEDRPIEEILSDACTDPHTVKGVEKNRAINYLFDMLDWSKPASEQPDFSPDEDVNDDLLEFLLLKLDSSIAYGTSMINIKANDPTTWRYLVVSLALSHCRLDQANKWKFRFERKGERNREDKIQLLGASLNPAKRSRGKHLKPDRNEISAHIDTGFNWLEWQCARAFTGAIARHRNTVGKFLKDKYPATARGEIQYYPVEIGLQLLKHWLTHWIKRPYLEDKFYGAKKDLSLEEMKAKLGTELLFSLEYHEGDEADKDRARIIILTALPGSVAHDPDDIGALFGI